MAGAAEGEEEAGCIELTEASLPEQRMVDGKAFPLVLTPSSPSDSAALDPGNLLKASKGFLEERLKDHGALFIRGLPLRTASQFQSAVEALGWETLPYVGSAPRTHVLGSVYTANDADPDVFINFHHEMAQIVDPSAWPSKVLFFCLTPPPEDGQTPIVMSHKVTESLWMRCPEFMQKLEDLGLLYLKVLPLERDPRHISRQRWPLVFGTSNQEEAEERAKKCFNAKVEWLQDGQMSMLSGPFEATKDFGRADSKAWFNMIVAYYTGLSHKGVSSDHPYDVRFGDGSPLPADAVETCKKIHEENSVDIPWQQGDFMIVDNLAAMHGRRAYKPPRQILVALCA